MVYVCTRSISHHNFLLVLEAAQGYRLAVLVVELKVRRRLSDRHHPQRRRADTLRAAKSGTRDRTGEAYTYNSTQGTRHRRSLTAFI